MVVPPPNTGNQNDANMNNDVQQWCNDNTQMTTDENTLNAALAQMGKDITDHNTDGAMMLLFTAVLPGVLTYQQDSMNMLADSQNISSDLRNFNNSIQDDFNEGEAITPDGANDLCNNVNDLNTWAKFLSSTNSAWTAGPKGNAPLSSTTATDIENNLTGPGGIESQFTSKGSFTPGSIQTQMKTWFTPPATPNPNGYTPGPNDGPAAPNPAIKAIQSNNQQINSAVSSQATTLNTQIQFFTSQYNQFVNVDAALQKSMVSQDTSLVNNQKAQ